MLQRRSYACAYVALYVAGLTAFLCFAFCLSLSLCLCRLLSVEIKGVVLFIYVLTNHISLISR